LEIWKSEKRRGIWIKIPIEKSHLIPEVVKVNKPVKIHSFVELEIQTNM
jgi:hypothetical protein